MSNIFTYDIVRNGICITGAKKYATKHWTIPNEIDGMPVTEIKAYAFALRDDVEIVNIPDSVRIIGKEAFRYCENLTCVSVYTTRATSIVPLEIDINAFHNCSALESFDASVPIYVREFAFWQCSSLREFNAKIIGADKMAFAECVKLRTVSFGRNAYWEANSFKKCKSLSHLFFYYPIARHMPTYSSKMKLLKGKTISCCRDFNCMDLAYEGYNFDVSL